MSDGDRAAKAEHYGAFRRGVLVLVGFAAALAGAGTSILLLVLFGKAVAEGKLRGASALQGGLATLFAVLLFSAFAVFGVARVINGVRGHSRPRVAAVVRAEGWYRRNWYLLGLVSWGGVSCGMLLASSDPWSFLTSPHPSFGRVAWYVFLGFLVLPVHVLVHEFAHAAVGALVGFRFVETRVGWLTVRRDGGRVRFSWTPPTIQGVFGFHIGMPHGGTAPVMRRAAFGAAGPLVTLAAALACRAAGEASGRTTTVGVIASDLLAVGWWMGAALAAMNIVPFRLRSGLMSDGAQVLLALLPRSAARETVLQFRSNCAQGRRPRDWGITSEAFLQAAEEAPDERDTLLLAALGVALDTGDQTGANEILKRVAKGITSLDQLARYELELQAVMVKALRGEAAAAREHLSGLAPHPTMEDYPRLAEAAVLLAEGRFSDGSTTLAKWERALADSGMAVALRVGNEWAVDQLRARLELAQASVS